VIDLRDDALVAPEEIGVECDIPYLHRHIELRERKPIAAQPVEEAVLAASPDSARGIRDGRDRGAHPSGASVAGMA
jgi:hypothetical protein